MLASEHFARRTGPSLPPRFSPPFSRSIPFMFHSLSNPPRTPLPDVHLGACALDLACLRRSPHRPQTILLPSASMPASPSVCPSLCLPASAVAAQLAQRPSLSALPALPPPPAHLTLPVESAQWCRPPPISVCTTASAHFFALRSTARSRSPRAVPPLPPLPCQC